MFVCISLFCKHCFLKKKFSIEKKVCDDASAISNGILPCTGEFEQAIDYGNECICQCRSGFTNSSTGCIGIELETIKSKEKYIYFYIE